MPDLNNINNQQPIEMVNNKQPVSPAKKSNNFFADTLIFVLICLFGASLLSAAYIVFNPAENKKVEEETPATNSLRGLKKLANIASPTAALIKIRGVIGEGQDSSWSSSQNASTIATKIRELAEEKNVHSLILDINSPGGSVAAVQDIYNAILYFKTKKKPVIALFRDVAASGGYYIAMAADTIVAQPGTITGSIGVIMQGMNVAPLLEKFGVSVKPIKSAKHKDIGSPYREMTDEEKQLLQDMINDTYAQFFDAVKKARPNIPEEKLRIYADGRVWTGNQAKALGLIDELGGMEVVKTLLEQKTKLKDIKIKNIKVYPLSDLGFIFGSAQSKLNTKIEELSSPKVSYLWTY